MEEAEPEPAILCDLARLLVVGLTPNPSTKPLTYNLPGLQHVLWQWWLIACGSSQPMNILTEDSCHKMEPILTPPGLLGTIGCTAKRPRIEYIYIYEINEMIPNAILLYSYIGAYPNCHQRVSSGS